MLKKAKAGLGTKDDGGAKEAAQSVLNSSHQIWLAGLGAFSRAQAEGMKMFEALVQQGEKLETRTRAAAADTAAAARGVAAAKAKEMQQMAGGTWDKLEQVFEDRVARALSKLGVYTQNDVQRLADRVDDLAEKVDALLKATGVQPKRASPMEKMVKGAVRSAQRTAASTLGSASRTAKSTVKTAKRTVNTATKTAKRTVRTAKKVAKAALS
jgi:poly(hydroxyalkanoate) granule-associated protein